MSVVNDESFQNSSPSFLYCFKCHTHVSLKLSLCFSDNHLVPTPHTLPWISSYHAQSGKIVNADTKLQSNFSKRVQCQRKGGKLVQITEACLLGRGPDYVAYVFVFLGSIIICQSFRFNVMIFSWSTLTGGPEKKLTRARIHARRPWQCLLLFIMASTHSVLSPVFNCAGNLECSTSDVFSHF
jgi:hypothetical protein